MASKILNTTVLNQRNSEVTEWFGVDVGETKKKWKGSVKLQMGLEGWSGKEGTVFFYFLFSWFFNINI